MGMIFSLAYVLTKRIAVSIMIHMMQNGFVVIMQVCFGDVLKHLQTQANAIFHLFFNQRIPSKHILLLGWDI